MQKLAQLILDHSLENGYVATILLLLATSFPYFPSSVSKLNQLEHKFDIPSVLRTRLAPKEVVQVVIDEVDKDVTQHNGPNYFKGKLKDHDIKISRYVDKLSIIMGCVAYCY